MASFKCPECGAIAPVGMLQLDKEAWITCFSCPVNREKNGLPVFPLRLMRRLTEMEERQIRRRGRP
jgi:hypothetical protein